MVVFSETYLHICGVGRVHYKTKEIMEKEKLSQAQIDTCISLYAKAGIAITELDDTKVKVHQVHTNGNLLTQKQLVDRGKKLYPDKIIIPVVYSLNVDSITPDWVKEQMSRCGIYQKDLVKQLAINKSTISKYLSGAVGMTKSVRALFFYYFLTFEQNRLFRK